MTMSETPKERNISLSHNIEMSFRVKGIPEYPDKTRHQIFVPTHEHVTHILKTTGVEDEIVNLRRLGKFQKEQRKPSAVLVILPSATSVNLVMARNVERRPELKDMNVFVSRDLSIEIPAKKTSVLKGVKNSLDKALKGIN